VSPKHDLDNGIIAKLNDFRDLFLRWNKQINLSAARTAADVDDHIADCLPVVDVLRPYLRILDVGSGGGFPVIVAAIALPDHHFKALEPVHKKHAFLRTAARELALPNLDPVAERLEDHTGRDYDAAMSRATFDLSDWLARGSRFVRTDGVVIGFEAQPRADLPASIQRVPYGDRTKVRSLVVFRV
jgi:16S rRNA (guanine527-N7)-methyltransferase